MQTFSKSRRDLGLAGGCHGAGRYRVARDLRACDLPRIAVLGPRSRSEAPHCRDDCRGRCAERRRPRVVFEGRKGWYPAGLHARCPAGDVGCDVCRLQLLLHLRHGRRLEPLYLSTEKHWSTAEYSSFYVCWGLVGFFGLCTAGWLADKIGRRVGFIALLVEGAVFMTLWVYALFRLTYASAPVVVLEI
jgi:hypothetical protein